MSMTIRIQLSLMMFIEFFIWGAWYVALFPYLQALGFGGEDIGSAYSTVALGAIIAPFFIGMISDRFFSAQKVLGVLHILGGVVLLYVTALTEPGPMFWTLVLYSACYMPTVALTNAIAFNQMKDPSSEFSGVRVLGTIGWIVAGVIIGTLEVGATPWIFKIAAGASFVLGIYSFTLPKTPPQSAGKKVSIRDILGLDALMLMKNRSFATFMICSLLISIPLSFYYQGANSALKEAGVGNSESWMTIGQVSEIFFMLLMPFFLNKLGIKKTIILGVLAWIVRYICFAYGGGDMPLFMLFVIGIAFHGICYDFFFVTGQIYVDLKAPKKLQASAQGLYALVTYGIGMYVGAIVAGKTVDKFQVFGEAVGNEAPAVIDHHWTEIWLRPAGMAVIVLLLFALFFKEDNGAPEDKGTVEESA